MAPYRFAKENSGPARIMEVAVATVTHCSCCTIDSGLQAPQIKNIVNFSSDLESVRHRLANRWAAQFALSQNPAVLLDVRYSPFIWQAVRAGSAINSRCARRYRLQEVDQSLRAMLRTSRYLSDKSGPLVPNMRVSKANLTREK
jgi:hypothetical protein